MPSALAGAEVATTPSAARSVWASPLYRGATVALFLSGLGTSAAAPHITLFLVNDLHVSLTTARAVLPRRTSPPASFYYLIGASFRPLRKAARAVPVVCSGGTPRASGSGDVRGRPGVDALRDQCRRAGLLGRAAVLATVRRGPRRPASDRRAPWPTGSSPSWRTALTAGWVVGPGLGLGPGDCRRFVRDARRHRAVRPRSDRPHGLGAHRLGSAPASRAASAAEV